MEKEAAIEAKGVWYRYGEPWILQDVSFSVNRGELLGILGPNGSGKTTLLRILDGILKPSKGGVLVAGRSLDQMSRRELALEVAVVPQEAPFQFSFTAKEVVAMGRSVHLSPLQFEGSRDLEVLERAMEMTDTWQFRDRDVNTLSGGERQRVLIARALAQQPRIVLLDEPTAFLDITHQVELFELIHTLVRDTHLTVVAVSHDINLAAQYCHRLLLLKKGVLHLQGAPGDVVTREALREVYAVDLIVDGHPLTGLPRVTIERKG